MSTPVVIGGGPRPTAQIYAVSPISPTDKSLGPPVAYEIRDFGEVLAHCPKLSHALALLPLIQSGE